MPLTSFICPNGQVVKTADCLKRCIMTERCYPLPVLTRMAYQRPSEKGSYSVTELLNPTRQMYLLKTNDFAESPDDLFFRVTGSGGHYFLDQRIEGMITEERLANEICSGQMDAYDMATETLYDYKFYPRYKVKKLNDTETLEMEGMDIILQLNYYRILLEQVKKVSVKRMILVAFVRDYRQYENYKYTKAGGKELLPEDKQTKPIYQIEIPAKPDDNVKNYFLTKKILLDYAFGKNEVPEICKPSERWLDEKTGVYKRCENYCAVSCFCEKDANNLTK